MKNSEQFKIFIVDDDLFCAKIYENYLISLNYTDITHFTNGNDCLNHLNLNPDIVFLDYNMDDITGFEVLKEIKCYNPDIYVIMISGQQAVKTAVEVLKCGAFDYITKESNVCHDISIIMDKITNIKEELKKSNQLLKNQL
ncbi:MAG TPA: response regulator [Flavobacterium sp.]|jgi:DNA-binding NtrC family response regulator